MLVGKLPSQLAIIHCSTHTREILYLWKMHWQIRLQEAVLSVLRTVDMVALSPPIVSQEHMLQTLQTFATKEDLLYSFTAEGIIAKRGEGRHAQSSAPFFINPSILYYVQHEHL